MLSQNAALPTGPIVAPRIGTDAFAMVVYVAPSGRTKRALSSAAFVAGLCVTVTDSGGCGGQYQRPNDDRYEKELGHVFVGFLM